MKLYPYKKLDFTEEDLAYQDFFISTRYSMTSFVDCENLYLFSKENDFSFFNLCVAAIYKTIESIPEFKQAAVDGEGREYEHLNIVLPLLKKDNTIEEVCVESIHDFMSFKDWDDFLNSVKDNTSDYKHTYSPESIKHPLAILSCVPWVHYASFNDISAGSDNYFPTVHWGKFENGKMPVTITINHTFIFGYHLGLFFNKLGELMENPDLIFQK